MGHCQISIFYEFEFNNCGFIQVAINPVSELPLKRFAEADRTAHEAEDDL